MPKKQIDVAIARQRRPKHVSVAANKYATVEKTLDALLSMRPEQRSQKRAHNIGFH
jgi:hypothetical protein